MLSIAQKAFQFSRGTWFILTAALVAFSLFTGVVSAEEESSQAHPRTGQEKATSFTRGFSMFLDDIKIGTHGKTKVALAAPGLNQSRIDAGDSGNKHEDPVLPESPYHIADMYGTIPDEWDRIVLLRNDSQVRLSEEALEVVFANMHSLIENLDSKLDSFLTGQYKENSDTLMDLVREVASLHGEIQSLKDENDRLATERAELLRQRKEMEERMERRQQVDMEFMEMMTSRMDAMESTVSEGRQQIQASVEAVSRLERKVEGVYEEGLERDQRIGNMEREIAKGAAVLKSFIEEGDTMKAQMDTYKQTMEDFLSVMNRSTQDAKVPPITTHEKGSATAQLYAVQPQTIILYETNELAFIVEVYDEERGEPEFEQLNVPISWTGSREGYFDGQVFVENTGEDVWFTFTIYHQGVPLKSDIMFRYVGDLKPSVH